MFARNLIIICASLYVFVVFVSIAQAQPSQIQSGLSYISASQNFDGTWGNDDSIGETTESGGSGLDFGLLQ